MSSTEELYPFMVPEDEEGFTWHIEYMTKEEIITTLEANDRRSNRISELVIENNRQYVTEFAPTVKTYPEYFLSNFDEMFCFICVCFVPVFGLLLLRALFYLHSRW